ncbi:MAG: protein adenylyltransferase SelO family protein, partial [Rhodoferax sp.]|nr:protein adenylyltransferase SelO family protein [Rhodoferax sp.]
MYPSPAPASVATLSTVTAGLDWQHSFAALGQAFSVPQASTPIPAPYWVGHSNALAQQLGLPADWTDNDAWLQALSGNAVLPGSQPIASVYSGHQFGIWAGQLGDGRALLLGETNGWEWQLKGAGLTPFSRMGDGRAVLRSSIREFLCSEAMHALGIPTTRALCVTGSDLPVRRETLETAAVVTRLAPSFIRFGHFEHFSYSGQQGALKRLADYVIERFYPHCHSDIRFGGNPYA